jgi:hypothetical protein
MLSHNATIYSPLDSFRFTPRLPPYSDGWDGYAQPICIPSLGEKGYLSDLCADQKVQSIL